MKIKVKELEELKNKEMEELERISRLSQEEVKKNDFIQKWKNKLQLKKRTY